MEPALINYLLNIGHRLGQTALATQLTATAGTSCNSWNVTNKLDGLVAKMQKAFPNANYVYIGFADTGNFVGCTTNSSTEDQHIGLSDESTSHYLASYEVDESGTRTVCTACSAQIHDASPL